VFVPGNESLIPAANAEMRQLQRAAIAANARIGA
jgi:hypothetical protein